MCSSHTPDSTNHRQSLQNVWDRIRQFETDWAIIFNTQNCSTDLHQHKRQPRLCTTNFDGQYTTIATHHKHLGLTLSKDFHFHDHINTIIDTINSLLGLVSLIQLQNLSPDEYLTTYRYCTHIRPHFDYCDIIYDGHMTSTDAARLQTAANSSKLLGSASNWDTFSNTDHFSKTWVGRH